MELDYVTSQTCGKRKSLLLTAVNYAVADSIFIDEDSSDEELILQLHEMRKKKKKSRVCILGYKQVVASYTASDFRHHFRISRSTFQVLIEKFASKLETPITARGRPSNDATKQLMVALWMLANQECYRTVADRFNISISMAWDYFHKVIDAIIDISKHVIMWPNSADERNKIATEFSKGRGRIKGVIGAIDGSHIPIATPKHMPNSYVNRNKYHSIVLQAVCDNSYRFLDCFAGYPGSVHDSRVLSMSPLGKKLHDNPGELLSGDQHLLGDSAYANRVYLIMPYKDNVHLTRKQKNFNYKHSSTRVCIEHAFGLLKGRFRILRFVNIYDTKYIPKVIIACCTLHNMCINLYDMDDVETYSEDSPEPTVCDEPLRDDTNGNQKRDRIADTIYP